MKLFIITLISSILFSITGFAAESSGYPTPTYTMEQKEVLSRNWEMMLDAIQPDGTMNVRIDGSKESRLVNGTDMSRYLLALNLGYNLEGTRFECHYYNDYYQIKSTIPAELKQQNKEVKAYVAEKVSGKEPSLETVKNLFSEYATTYHYFSSEKAHGAIDTIQNHTGNCADYASLFKAEMDALGLENYVILGNLIDRNTNSVIGKHAWNAVVIDGVHYTIDIAGAIANYSRGLDIWTMFQVCPDYMLNNSYVVTYILVNAPTQVPFIDSLHLR